MPRFLNQKATMCTFLAVGATALLASSASAEVKTDKLSGLTPGHRIRCEITPRGGGDPIPATDIVAADGTAEFVKPNVEIGTIKYFDMTNGGKQLEGMSSSSGSDLHRSLTPGYHFPLMGSGFFDVFTENLVDIYPQDFPVTVGSEWTVIDGHCPIPGTLVFNDDGSAFTGTVTMFGWNTVGVVPEPTSLSLLTLGALLKLRRRT